MVDYANSLALAQRLINANGRSISVQRLSNTPADVAKPWEGTATPTVLSSVAAIGAFVPHTGQDDLGKYLVDEELLKRCEQVVLVAYDGTNDIDGFNQLIDGSQTWGIVWIRKLQPGSVIILYAIGVGR